MLKSIILGAAALVLTTPAMATCLEGRVGAQCDIFLDDYRAVDVPVGTVMVWPQRQFLLEDINWRDIGIGIETISGEDAYYWDGDDAFVVPENSGPPIKIADW